MQLGDLMAESFRTGERPIPNSSNRQTVNRRKLYSRIKEQAGGNTRAELDYCLNIISDNLPTIQQYVMSRGETPAQGVEELAIQASTLRQKEAESVAGAIDTSVDDALVFLEDDEATNMDANISMGENYLGMLAAPVQIAAHHLVKGVVDKDQVDNFVDPAIIAGIINTAGAKINSADLKRAANNKPAGLLGALGQGGTKAYDALRKYLNDPTNADEKKAVLSGVITDVSQLRMFNTDQVPNTGGGSGLKLLGKDLVDEVAKQKKKEVIQKYLPIIIIGLVALIIIVVLIARKK